MSSPVRFRSNKKGTSEDQDKEYVGFATLPNQVHRKTVKKGFTFTLMVAGETGLGKSTLINSLFLTDLYKDRKVPNAEERIGQTVDIVKHTIGIEEKGIKLWLSIVDTPGFGDAVNNTASWKHVEDYIDQQFEQYFRDESGLNRKNIKDNRVHCLLYFISPFGHGLRPIDVECMKALHEKVNIIPLLAKADSLTHAEAYSKKSKIREEIKQFGINIYQFPECESDEDEDSKRQEQILKDSIPFAVIGSNIQVESKGRKFRGRSYPWGVVEEPDPLRLPAAAEHAGEDAHAGSEGRDAGDPLRKLPGAVHPEHDPHDGAGEETQVGGARPPPHAGTQTSVARFSPLTRVSVSVYGRSSETGARWTVLCRSLQPTRRWRGRSLRRMKK
uniref:Septin 4a n=1 Tax=Fundulus heteroclitus TaxID=8078 RepID=A0A3Q2R2H7_FUNHE